MRSILRILPLCVLMLGAPALAGEPEPAPAKAPGAACAVVTVPTSDGLNLAADHCPAKDGAPVVVLLHMIPPHHDRTNYPAAFRTMLVEAGIEVLNLDRRGGGDSHGDPKQAYTGPHGVKDVQAALDWLGTHSKANLESWGCVGASNGTTTCLDYAVHALDSEGLRGPSALVFMTGGKYTENQNVLAGSAVQNLPVLFTYNAQEAEWSESQKKSAPEDIWRWSAYEPGGHGTRVFESNPESMQDVIRFLAGHLNKTPAP